MSPGEEEEGGGAAAAVEEVPTAVEPEEPEAVPDPDQEQPAEEADVSGDQGEEDEAEAESPSLTESVMQATAELAEANPEVEAALRAKYATAPDSDAAAQVNAQVARERTIAANYAAIDATYNKGIADFSGAVDSAAKELAGNVNSAARDLGASDDILPQVKLSEAVQPQITKAAAHGRMWGAYGITQAVKDVIFAQLGETYTSEYLDRWLGGMSISPNTPDAITAMLNALVAETAKADPDGKVKKALENHDADINKLADGGKHLETLLAAVGKNGKTSGSVSRKKTAPTLDFDELEHLYAIGEITPAQEQDYIKQRREKGLE